MMPPSAVAPPRGEKMSTMATIDEAQMGDATTQHRRRLWPKVSGTQVTDLFYAGIWMVLLAMPVVATALAEVSWGWKLVSYTATAIFALMYGWFMAWWTHPETPCPSRARLITSCLALLVPVAFTLPATGGWSSVFIPFIAAAIIFNTAPLPGIPIGVGIWIALTLAVYLLLDQEFWVIAGPGFGMLFIIISRLTEHYDARARAAEDQLNHAEERDRIARDVHDVLGHSLTV